MPEIGYQEVYLARAYARLGHEVQVFTSTAVSPTGKKIVHSDYPPGISIDQRYGYKVLRLRPFFRWGAKVLCRGLRREVNEFRPQIVILLAVAKLFPFPLLNRRTAARERLVAIHGDALEYVRGKGFAGKLKYLWYRLSFLVFKGFLYRRVVKLCHRVVLNIPETEELFASFLSARRRKMFLQKKKNLRLGFDPDEFYFDVNERTATRKALGIPDDAIVIMTSTRVNPRKRLEENVDLIDELAGCGHHLHYIISGFLEDDYGDRLRAYIAGKKRATFHCLPFLEHDQVRCYFNAADIGIWSKVAISIQEAMGTGLMVMLEKKASVSHLLENGRNGWYFDAGQMKPKLSEVLSADLRGNDDCVERRRYIARQNFESLSYDEIVRNIIESVEAPGSLQAQSDAYSLSIDEAQ